VAALQLKRILFVNGSETIEGDTRVLINTVKHLDPARFERSCVTIGGAARDELAQIPHVRLFDAPLGPTRRWLPGPPGSAAAWGAAIVATARAARSAHADVIYTYDRTRATEVAWVVARLLRKPLLFHAHYPFHLDARRMRRRVAFSADRIVAISSFVAGRYLEAGCPAERLTVVENGVEPYDAPPPAAPLRERLDIPADAPVVGMVGRLSPFKGQEELIRAAGILRSRFPGLRVVISGRDTDESMWTHGGGETSTRAVLERVRAELGLDAVVDFTGFNASAAEVYGASDVVALPSHEEPFGLVVVEAMLARKPVVSCNSGGVPEIITHGEHGLLVPPKDPDALAGAIGDLLDSPDERARLAIAGERRARERFLISRYIADFEAVVDGVG
jgi:glycosyltransferase involved in cell wall biosynthesis